jgi:hypothetical protein
MANFLFILNGRVSSGAERGSSSYWDAQLLWTIASSGIPIQEILIGYLGPTDEDTYNTPVTMKPSSKTYEAVVIANVILDILKELN